jgi:hypothetical protein
VYTTTKLYYQLEQAKTECIRDNVMVKNQIIYLPTVLHYYVKDVALKHMIGLCLVAWDINAMYPFCFSSGIMSKAYQVEDAKAASLVQKT